MKAEGYLLSYTNFVSTLRDHASIAFTAGSVISLYPNHLQGTLLCLITSSVNSMGTVFQNKVKICFVSLFFPREKKTTNCTYNNSIRVDEEDCVSCERVLSVVFDLKRGQSRVFWGALSHFYFPASGQAVVACVAPSSLYFYHPDGSAFSTARSFSSRFAN